jgi:hypothetical protein
MYVYVCMYVRSSSSKCVHTKTRNIIANTVSNLIKAAVFAECLLEERLGKSDIKSLAFILFIRTGPKKIYIYVLRYATSCSEKGPPRYQGSTTTLRHTTLDRTHLDE